MDLKSLSSINIKNINAAQIKELYKSRPDIFINILLIGITLYATMYIYNGAKTKKLRLSQDATMAQAKWKVAEQLAKVDKEVKEFQSKFPKAIESDQFTSKLSEIALKNNVQTLSFAPPQKNKDENVELTTVSFNIASEEYPNVLTFIKDIEAAQYALRIQKVSASLAESDVNKRRSFQDLNLNDPIQTEEEIKKYIEVNIEVGLVDLKR